MKMRSILSSLTIAVCAVSGALTNPASFVAALSSPLTVVATGYPDIDTPAVQDALDQCAGSGRPLILDATTTSFVIAQTLVLKPQSGTQMTEIDIEGHNRSNGAPTIWFSGVGVCLKTYGMKNSTIEHVRIQLRNASGIGMWFTSNTNYQSTSFNTVSHCTVTANAPGQDTGFWIGPEDSNQAMGDGSNDINSFTFDRCYVSGAAGSAIWMDYGFRIWGRNTKSLKFDGCGVSRINKVAFDVEPNPTYHNYAYVQGLQFTGCDSSHVQTAFRIKGGCEALILGGRTEVTGDNYAIEGVAGGGYGYIKVLGFKDAGQTVPRVQPGDTANPITIL